MRKVCPRINAWQENILKFLKLKKQMFEEEPREGMHFLLFCVDFVCLFVFCELWAVWTWRWNFFCF